MTNAAADARLPWWRRPRKLRRQLAGTLVAVAFVSVAIVGGLNFFAASELLDDGNQESLSGIGESQARTIQAGTARLLASVSAFAADLGVVEALTELRAEFDALEDESLDPAEADELDAYYERAVITPLEEVGIGPVGLADVQPATDAGRYLQYHYTLADDEEAAAARGEVVDAGDGSGYSAAHEGSHEFLSDLAANFGASDLLLIADDGTVVYTVEKRIDLGTNLEDGPYQSSALANAVAEDLVKVPVGEAVVADYERYLPGGAAPRLFAVAAVRSETEVVGSLAVQIPVEAINTITAADGRWEEVGLRGGESYVVGSDRLLRSESRRWIEDPSGYLDEVDDDETARLIEVFGSPVGFQEVDTDPVLAALQGDTFEGVTRNYLGSRTYTYATPIAVPGAEWVVVADIPLDDAREPLLDFAGRLGLVMLLILPAAAVVGIALSRRLTRPIPPVVEAAAAIAAGERNPELPDPGNDEFGDLARRLLAMSEELERQEAALAEESHQSREMLLTVLPPRLVDDEGGLVSTEAEVDTATVVAVWITVETPGLGADDAVLELLSDTSRLVDELALDRGLERVRGAADHHLLLAGFVEAGDGVEDALAFAVALEEATTSLAASEQVTVSAHVGLSTGRVATGMLQRGGLTFAAWGMPVRRALAIGAVADARGIIVDGTVSDAASAGWAFEEIGELAVFEGAPMKLFAPARVSATDASS